MISWRERAMTGAGFADSSTIVESPWRRSNPTPMRPRFPGRCCGDRPVQRSKSARPSDQRRDLLASRLGKNERGEARARRAAVALTAPAPALFQTNSAGTLKDANVGVEDL